MSALEDFLRRWSQRKRAAAEAEHVAPPPDAATPGADPPAATEIAPAAPALPTIDLASLPTIESITAATDVSGFLAPGVPPDLTRAALRRAWVADPAIRDFVGIAENQWDFTAPDGVPGFGPLADDVARRLVAELLGEPAPENRAESPPPPASSPPTTVQPSMGPPPTAEEPAIPAIAKDLSNIAVQQDQKAEPAPQNVGPRSHGGALPE